VEYNPNLRFWMPSSSSSSSSPSLRKRDTNKNNRSDGTSKATPSPKGDTQRLRSSSSFSVSDWLRLLVGIAVVGGVLLLVANAGQQRARDGRSNLKVSLRDVRIAIFGGTGSQGSYSLPHLIFIFIFIIFILISKVVRRSITWSQATWTTASLKRTFESSRETPLREPPKSY